ncbi:MAG: hypothetical protein RR101_15385, partial [Burkholderiaceae bacterium]
TSEGPTPNDNAPTSRHNRAMPSPLVTSIRALIRERRESGRPVSDLERAMILSAVTAHRTDGDVAEELERAINNARGVLLSDPEPFQDVRRAAVRRLLAAARAALDYEPAPHEYDPTAAATEKPRRDRADIDG